ncbi:MAG: hypothetical protein WA461_15495, partial [Nitrososphaeraceae archaeon]
MKLSISITDGRIANSSFRGFCISSSHLNRNLDKIRNNMDYDIGILGLEDFKRKQKLYNLLKSQYEAELSELSHYMELLG